MAWELAAGALSSHLLQICLPVLYLVPYPQHNLAFWPKIKTKGKICLQLPKIVTQYICRQLQGLAISKLAENPYYLQHI